MKVLSILRRRRVRPRIRPLLFFSPKPRHPWHRKPRLWLTPLPPRATLLILAIVLWQTLCSKNVFGAPFTFLKKDFRTNLGQANTSPKKIYAVKSALMTTTAPSKTWTAETSSLMVSQSADRAISTSVESEALASLLLVYHLRHYIPFPDSKLALEKIATKTSLPSMKIEGKLLAEQIEQTRNDEAFVTKNRELGLLTDLSILGPFRDTGERLNSKEGAELSSGHAFNKPELSYHWGSIEVSLRRIQPAFVSASGLPLDLFVHPRKESCSYLGTALLLEEKKTFVIHAASTGSIRLLWDMQDLSADSKDETVQKEALFDRLSLLVQASPGVHFVGAKVCSGALPDQGRLRLRISDESGNPLKLEHTSDLSLLPDTFPKSSWKYVSTPLQKMLSATGPKIQNQNDAEYTLYATMARVFAGADDLRSPKAQGLIDSLISYPSLSDDFAAMAAWMSPSLANRSGFYSSLLNRRDLPLSVKSFVERRRLADHLGAGMVDWAYMNLIQAGIDKKTDPEAILYSSAIQNALGTFESRQMAFSNLWSVFERNKKKCATSILAQLSSWSSSLDRAKYVEVASELKDRSFRGAASVELASFLGTMEAISEAKNSRFYLDNANEGLTIAAYLSDIGAHRESLEYYRFLASLSPNRSEIFYGLASELGSLDEVKQNQINILRSQIAALNRARELDPPNAKLRSEFNYRMAMNHRFTQLPSDEPSLGRNSEDLRYMMASDDILKRRKGIPSGIKQEEERELHWLRVVTMHPDKRVSQLIHYAKEIVIPPKTTDELYEELPVEGDLTEILRARVYHPDGSVSLPIEEKNDGRRPSIRWPELNEGDTIEVAIRGWTQAAVGGRGDAPFYFLDYAGAKWTRPLLYNEVVVIFPKNSPIYVDVINPDKFERSETDLGDKRELRFKWTHPTNVPDEPFAPALSEIVPVLVGSTFRDWDQFRSWYGEAVSGFTEPDEQIKRIAAQLTQNSKTEEEKLNSIFNFVSDDIRYVNFVSGEWWLPNRPQQVLAKREGDCDDKAILLIALLKAIGVDAKEVLVQTRITNMGALLRSKQTAIPMFDHGIAFLPDLMRPGQGRYLDATSPRSRIGPLASMVGSASALRMDGPAEIVTMPEAKPWDHSSKVTWVIRISENGSAEVKADEMHSGDSAFWLRTNMFEKDSRTQYVENALISDWFPAVNVKPEIELNSELKDGKARVRYEFSSGSYASLDTGDNNALVVPLSPSMPMTASLAPTPSRELPVQLPPQIAPSEQTRIFLIEAPKTYEFKEIPDSGKIDGGAFGSVSLTFSKRGHVLMAERKVTFKKDRISVAEYKDFRQFLLNADALLKKSIRMAKVQVKEKI